MDGFGKVRKKKWEEEQNLGNWSETKKKCCPGNDWNEKSWGLTKEVFTCPHFDGQDMIAFNRGMLDLDQNRSCYWISVVLPGEKKTFCM